MRACLFELLGFLDQELEDPTRKVGNDEDQELSEIVDETASR